MPTQLLQPSASSDERALSIVNGVEDTLLYLFDPQQNKKPFAATNLFFYGLVRSHTEALRQEIRHQNEALIFEMWKEFRGKFHATMLGESERVQFTTRLVSPELLRADGPMSLLTARQLDSLKKICPKPPRRRE